MADIKTVISGIVDVQNKTVSKIMFNNNAIISLSGGISALSGHVNILSNTVESIVNDGIQISLNNTVEIALGPCSNLNIYLNSSIASFNWTDPDDLELNGAILAKWEQTVLVRKENSYPSSYLDGEIIASTNSSNKNYYKDHIFIDDDLEGKTYYYKLFSKSTNNVWNNLLTNNYPFNTDYSWKMVQQIVKEGRGADFFPVSTTFIVDHSEYTTLNNTPGIAFTVLGHDQVPAADETIQHTMCLGMSEILFNSGYDAAELVSALTEDLITIAGKTYYTYDGSTLTELIEGTDYQIGDSIPAATYYEKNNAFSNQYNNKFSESNILQWANSSGSAITWFVKQNIWDTCGGTLKNKNGFLRYLDQNFLAVVKEAKITTLLSNAYNKSLSSEIINAKFWALSKTQITGELSDNIQENLQLSYYAAGNSLIKYLSSTGEVAGWLTRTPEINRGRVYYIDLNGEFTTKITSTTYGISLACIIG